MNFCSNGFDRFDNAFDFVAAQIVHDDDIPRTQFFDQVLLNPGKKDLSVDRAVNHQRSDPSTGPDCSDKRGCFPATARNVFDQTAESCWF